MIHRPAIIDKTPVKFNLGNDFYIHGDAYGKSSDPVVILLHGGGQTRHSWGDTAISFSKKGWYAMALDARGHGDSNWSDAGDYSADVMAQDLKIIIEQLNTKPALIGASMGGITSLIAAGESETTLASALVLVDIAPKTEQKGIERIFAFMSAHNEGFESIDDAAMAVANYLPNRQKPTDTSRLEKNLRLKTDGRYYWHWDPKILTLWKSMTPEIHTLFEERMYSAAEKLTIPTLIVRGGISDVVSEKVMAEFLDVVPNVESFTVSGAGHMVAGDSNHAFTNAVLEFLERNLKTKTKE